MATNFYIKVSIGGSGGGGSVVTSVNGRNGAVTLDKTDVGLNNVDNVSLLAQDAAQKEPTGFPNRTDSGISFDDFTRTFYIAATGASFDIWVKGINYVFPSGLAIGKQISTTAGNHYIYFDDAGNIQETTTFSVDLFINNAMIAIVYWNSDTNTHTYFADERHGMQMDGATHGYLHTVFGARYLTGLALQGFVADGTGGFDVNAQFYSDSGTIRDEDILLNISTQSQIPIFYREGSLWRKKTADAFPIIYNGTAGYTGTRVPYNQFVTGNWQLTEVTNNDFVLVHFFATNDANNGVIGILGINKYSNTPAARAAADSEISTLSGLPFAEFTAIGSVIFQTQTSYTNTPKARVVSSNPSIGEVYVDFRGEQLYTPSGVATSHSLLSNLASDDHTQYYDQVRGDARYVQNSTITGAVTTILSADLTASKALQSNASGKVEASAVTSTELGYVSGVTSSIQTQLDNKEPLNFIPKLSGIETYRGILFQNNSTTIATENIAGLSTNGSPTARAVANTNQLTKQVRLGYAVSTPAANGVCGVRSLNLLWSIGSGFRLSFSFAYTDSAFNTGARQFYGMHSLAGGITISSTVTVESLTNMFCIGSDAADTSLCIFYNDASGTASKIVLGATDFPANRGAGAASTDIFSVDFYNELGTSTVKYRVINLTTLVKAHGTLSTDLPASSTLLTYQAIRTSGASSNACSMDLTKLGCWSLA